MFFNGPNPGEQQRPFTMFGGPPPQRSPLNNRQGPPPLFRPLPQPLNNRSQAQGQGPSFFNNTTGNFGFNNIMKTAGHAMNGFNMLRTMGSFMSFFK